MDTLVAPPRPDALDVTVTPAALPASAFIMFTSRARVMSSLLTVWVE